MKTVIFTCKSWNEVQWKFNGGNIPTDGVISKFDEYSELHILIITIKNTNYFGYYSCHGIDYKLEKGFYDYVKLRQIGKLLEWNMLFY